jgi:hypothetical protein|nr:MAG TPA: hypothetical protein [Caudoviricetes sp.]
MASIKYELDMITKNIELAKSISDITLQLDMYNTSFNRLMSICDDTSKIDNIDIVKEKVLYKVTELIAHINGNNPIFKLPYNMYYYIRPFCKLARHDFYKAMCDSSISRYIYVSEKFYLLFEGYLNNEIDNAYYYNIILDILDTIKNRKIYATDNEILLQYIKAHLKSIIKRLFEIERIIINPDKYIPGKYHDMSINDHMAEIGLDKVKDIPLDEINKTVDNLIIQAYAVAMSKKSEDDIKQSIADEFEIYLSENVNIGGLGLRYGGNELYEHADELIKILNRIKEVK